jgi:hypothetical protein
MPLGSGNLGENMACVVDKIHHLEQRLCRSAPFRLLADKLMAETEADHAGVRAPHTPFREADG